MQGADRGGFSLAVDAVPGGIGRTQAHKKCAMTAIDARVVIRASLGESVKGKNRTICEERQLLDGSGGGVDHRFSLVLVGPIAMIDRSDVRLKAQIGNAIILQRRPARLYRITGAKNSAASSPALLSNESLRVSSRPFTSKRYRYVPLANARPRPSRPGRRIM